MSKQLQSRGLFHKGHYNIIAARLREINEDMGLDFDDLESLGSPVLDACFRMGRSVLEAVGCELAQTLLTDNPTNFDPALFLERAGFNVPRLLQRLEHRKAGLSEHDKDSGADVS